MTNTALSTDHPDRSNGWEALADEFIRYSRTSTIGVAVIETWAATLRPGGRVLDPGRLHVTATRLQR